MYIKGEWLLRALRITFRPHFFALPPILPLLAALFPALEQAMLAALLHIVRRLWAPMHPSCDSVELRTNDDMETTISLLSFPRGELPEPPPLAIPSLSARNMAASAQVGTSAIIVHGRFLL